MKINLEKKTNDGKISSFVKEQMKIVQETKTKENFIEEFLIEIKEFGDHAKRIQTQYRALKNLKENLTVDEAMIQMDFSENYECQIQEEIQSAYWDKTPITLHPAVVFFKENGSLGHKCIVCISDDKRHNADAVFAFMKELIPQVKSCYPKLKLLHYWTDSPTSQYRNKTIVTFLSLRQKLFSMKASWNYFKAGHGKGPCDGIGGTAKRMADEAIKHKTVEIQDALDFYRWAEESQGESEAHYVFVSKDDITKNAEHLSDLCKDIISVKGTMKAHSAQPTGDYKVLICDTSCFCHNCHPGNASDKETAKCVVVGHSIHQRRRQRKSKIWWMKRDIEN